MTEETASPDACEMTASTMLGDLVSAIIDEIKAAPDVWQKLSQDAQYTVIQRVRERAESMVKEAVRLIAADGRETIAADLEQITAKDGIKAVLTLPRSHDQRHALLDAVGKPVLIVVAGNSQFLGGELPQPQSDQRDLPIDTPVADNTVAAAA